MKYSKNKRKGLIVEALLMLLVTGIFVTVGIVRQRQGNLPSHAEAYAPSPGNTYADWYFPNGSYDSIEWTVTPLTDPGPSLAADGLLHYYAATFYTTNATNAIGGGYAGFQTNGYFNGNQQGKVVNFAFWGSNGGEGPDLVNPNNTESGGYQIMTHLNWYENHAYKFTLAGSTTDASGRWWTLNVLDTTTGANTYIGRTRVPTTIAGKASNKLTNYLGSFGEDLHWWRTLNGTVVYGSCSAFQKSSQKFSAIKANGTVAASTVSTHTNSGEINTGSNGFKTKNCTVTTYTGNDMSVQENLGYWSSPAPDMTKPTPAPSTAAPKPENKTPTPSTKTKTPAPTKSANAPTPTPATSTTSSEPTPTPTSTIPAAVSNSTTPRNPYASTAPHTNTTSSTGTNYIHTIVRSVIILLILETFTLITGFAFAFVQKL